jgi:hypothetical protein
MTETHHGFHPLKSEFNLPPDFGKMVWALRRFWWTRNPSAPGNSMSAPGLLWVEATWGISDHRLLLPARNSLKRKGTPP